MNDIQTGNCIECKGSGTHELAHGQWVCDAHLPLYCDHVDLDKHYVCLDCGQACHEQVVAAVMARGKDLAKYG